MYRCFALLFSLTLSLTLDGTPQQPVASGTSVTAQPETVIRSSARLVQLSVVVEDRKGNPVTGLTQEDFTVLDEGKPQTIASFTTVMPDSDPAVHPSARLLPLNVFTNRYDLKGEQAPSAITIVLFDALNTSPEDQSYVRKEVIRFLQSVKPEDHVAVYGLTTQLLVLHDLTRDSADLVAAAQRFSPKELAAFDASHTPDIDLVSLGADTQWASLQNAVNNANGEISDMHKVSRVGTTVGALEAIANHVAGIPGRKSLVWISGGFPIQIGAASIGKPSGGGPPTVGDTRIARGGGAGSAADTGSSSGLTRPDRDKGTFEDEVKLAAEALSRANIAVYAIDAKGVEVDPTTDFSKRGARLSDPVMGTAVLNSELDARESSQMLADRTGGLAFFGNNDIRGAIHRAFEDGRYAYTLGFYPNHGQWDGRFRKLKVEVKRDHLRLRYRTGYYASPDRPDSKSLVATALEQAAESPLEATNLSMIVSGKGATDSRSIDLHIGIDPKQLLLESSNDHRRGAVDLLFLQRDGAGAILGEDRQHIDVNLEEKQFQFLAKAAMVLDRHVTLQPQASEIRIVARDAGSGTVGSVVVPVKALLAADAGPAKKNQ